jgi:hypothetical protein
LLNTQKAATKAVFFMPEILAAIADKKRVLFIDSVDHCPD